MWSVTLIYHINKPNFIAIFCDIRFLPKPTRSGEKGTAKEKERARLGQSRKCCLTNRKLMNVVSYSDVHMYHISNQI